MKKIILGIGLLVLLGGASYAQGEILEQPRIFYRNERSFGLMMNTNGFGAGYRYGKRINARNKTIYSAGFSFIKHPKELKINNTYDYRSRSFVFGKKNSFIDLETGWGRQKEMFRKVDRGGISVRRYFTLGPTLGILKPVYYEIYNYMEDVFTIEKFSADVDRSNIYGRASFFKGLKEISFVPGATASAGFSFEYSTSDISIHALEAGLTLNFFPKRIEIMAMDIQNNSFYFVSLFVSYRFGKVIDASGIVDSDDLY